MQDFYLYIDYGAGDVLVNPTNLENSTLWIKRPINDVIQRKELEGTFSLNDAEALAAKVYFIDNGNDEAPIKLYENGDSGSGVLQFEGWARRKGGYDFRREIITLESFRTEDEYSGFLPYINNTVLGESATGFFPLANFAAQGQDTNANQLFNYTFDGTNFNLSGTGSPLGVPNLGRCSADEEASEIIVHDNVNDTLKGYTISASQWSESRTRTLLLGSRNGAVAGITGNNVALAIDGINALDIYPFSIGSFGTPTTFTISKIKFPSMCWSGARLAIVDENQKTLREVSTITGFEGTALSLGDVLKPQITTLDTATERIAFIDAKQRKLIAFNYTGGVWAQVGSSLDITNLTSPMIAQHAANQIILHDTVAGKLEMYNFSGTVWSKTGNTTTLSDGYMSGVSSDGTNIMVAISDTFPFRTSANSNYYGYVNGVMLQNGIQGTTTDLYELPTTGHGATMDINKIVLTSMTDVADNSDDAGSLNKYKYKLSDLLKWYELFQNYWYIEKGTAPNGHKIKFTQPDLFSSTGTDINISGTTLGEELEQRLYKDEYNIDQEELILNNILNADFDGNKIDYSRNTPVIETKTFPFTTDLEYIRSIFTGELVAKINSGGLLMYYLDDSTGTNLAVSGTGIISTVDTKNYLVSQSQIYNDFWKDYRYKEQGTILINGSSSAVQDTVRDIIEYTDIENLSYEDAGITQFPATIGSIIWGGGIPNSYITEFGVNLYHKGITIRSRLLDL